MFGLQIASLDIALPNGNIRPVRDPLGFLQRAWDSGWAGGQLALGVRTGDLARAVAHAVLAHDGYIEGVVTAPLVKWKLNEFEAEIQFARSCGVSVVRTVLSPGRRYEELSSVSDIVWLRREARSLLQVMEPIARRHGVRLAIENHKDFAIDELIEIVAGANSDFVAICLDTGNSIALLEDPWDVVRALAPFVASVHLKDVRMQRDQRGFWLSEVPLGDGCLELVPMISTIRSWNSAVNFNLEMITRDPLLVPCLTGKYAATATGTATDMTARTLALVRASERGSPLPRVSAMPHGEQLAIEEANIRSSFEFLRENGLIL